MWITLPACLPTLKQKGEKGGAYQTQLHKHKIRYGIVKIGCSVGFYKFNVFCLRSQTAPKNLPACLPTLKHKRAKIKIFKKECVPDLARMLAYPKAVAIFK